MPAAIKAFTVNTTATTTVYTCPSGRIAKVVGRFLSGMANSNSQPSVASASLTLAGLVLMSATSPVFGTTTVATTQDVDAFVLEYYLTAGETILVTVLKPSIASVVFIGNFSVIEELA